MRTRIHPDMTAKEYDRALDEFAADVDGFLVYGNLEVDRAEAIHSLRAREGRTIGKGRRETLSKIVATAEHMVATFDEFLAKHRDPTVVREAARFERLRARLQ